MLLVELFLLFDVLVVVVDMEGEESCMVVLLISMFFIGRLVENFSVCVNNF